MDIKCFKCQWEDQPMPYTVVFVGVNPHASEFSTYSGDMTMFEHCTEPLGPPSWRVLFSIKFEDMPYKVRRNVTARHKALWKKANTSPPAGA